MLMIIGLGLAVFSCFFFVLMVFYGIIAECCGFPMPLDDRYLLGKINNVIFIGSMSLGLILIIIGLIIFFIF